MTELRSKLLFFLINLAGLLAFAFPFFATGDLSTETQARAADAPWLMALLSVLVLSVAFVEASSGRMDAKVVALLGVLAGVAALLRIPVSLAGANLLFFLPIVAGYVFGVRFGFLLGALGMAVSALVTGGAGPWLPFQMWAAGWVGAGAGLLRGAGSRLASRPWVSVSLLAIYGYLAGLLYGFVINLYFWPLVPLAADLGWSPGLPWAEAWGNYLRFYLLTSLGWDAIGGLGNLVVIMVAGGPVVDLLRRYERRFTLEIA